MKVREECDGFRRHLEGRQRAWATIHGYVRTVEPFARFLEARGVTDLRTVKMAEVDAYEAHLGERKLAVQTQRVMLRGLKRFFEYLVETGKLFTSPAEHLRDPREARAPKQIGNAQVARVLAAPNVRRPAGVRDRAILELLRATGLRRMELCALAVYDVDIDGGQLRLRSATGASERLVPFGGDAGKWLKKYVREVRPRHAKQAAPGERRLFLQTTGRPMTVGALWSMLQKYRKATGVPLSCLALRRTARAALVKSGVDGRRADQILGIGMGTGATE